MNRIADVALEQPTPRRPKICLAASGGGHIRQLFDLEPAWADCEHFFITEKTGLTQSLANGFSTYFVKHYAIGQARLGHPIRFIAGLFNNIIQSWNIIRRERPDILISTGAGSAFFSVFWAKFFGSYIIIIESFARFSSLSLFMRISAPFANIRIVQSRLLGKHLPDAYVFDPMEILAAERPPKKSLMLVTVGATLPFDRMVSSVATLKINGTIEEDVVIQTGVGGARPSGLETHEVLPFDQMLALLREADIVVCHGGTGSIITALREGCRVVAMPRRFEDGEHYDNHQLEITRALEQRGLIAVAQSTEELAHALSIVRSRPPVTATLRPSELVEFLKSVIDDWRSEADGSSSSKIFGVEMCTLTAGELVDSIVNSPPRDGVRLLATMNVDHVVRLRTDERFRKAYARAWRITADGAPVFAYARTRNIPVPQRLTGSDLTPDLLRRMPFDRCLFFVVSSSETGERLLSSLIDRGFPERQLAYLCPPFGFESDRMMSSKIVEAITAHGTTDLFLGVGAPKSEIWVDEHRDMLGNMYAYCFGAGLDYFAGRSTRAPIAFRNMGMEWFWRLTREPVRLWHRYLIDSWAFFPAVFQDLRGRAPHGKRRIHD